MLQIVLVALFAWRILAMKSGQEVIEAVGEEVKVKTFEWRSFVLAAEELRLAAAGGECKAEVDKVYDALRYADPMSNEALEPCTREIEDNLHALRKSIAEKKDDETRQLCAALLDQIKMRNTKCKLLK